MGRDSSTIDALREACAAEKAQALFYRALTGAAVEAGDIALADRLNQLLADEHHHLSRLTARLIELGAGAPALDDVEPPAAALETWERTAREREREEVARYTRLLEGEHDPATAALLAEILRVEREHERNLAGKWTTA